MSVRWLFITVSIVLATAILSRLGFAISYVSPLHPKAGWPGGIIGVFIVYQLAMAFFAVTAGLLLKKHRVGLLTFAIAVVLYALALDLPYSYGGLPLFLILAAYGLFDYRSGSNRRAKGAGERALL